MGDQGYRLVFELAAQPSPWTGLWILLGTGLVALALFAFAAARIVIGFAGGRPRAGRTTWFLAVFTGLIAAALVFGGFHQMARERALQENFRTGKIQSVEGCLASFHPQPSTGGDVGGEDERWTAARRTFSNGHGDKG